MIAFMKWHNDITFREPLENHIKASSPMEIFLDIRRHDSLLIADNIAYW